MRKERRNVLVGALAIIGIWVLMHVADGPTQSEQGRVFDSRDSSLPIEGLAITTQSDGGLVNLSGAESGVRRSAQIGLDEVQRGLDFRVGFGVDETKPARVRVFSLMGNRGESELIWSQGVDVDQPSVHIGGLPQGQYLICIAWDDPNGGEAIALLADLQGEGALDLGIIGGEVNRVAVAVNVRDSMGHLIPRDSLLEQFEIPGRFPISFVPAPVDPSVRSKLVSVESQATLGGLSTIALPSGVYWASINVDDLESAAQLRQVVDFGAVLSRTVSSSESLPVEIVLPLATDLVAVQAQFLVSEPLDNRRYFNWEVYPAIGGQPMRSGSVPCEEIQHAHELFVLPIGKYLIVGTEFSLSPDRQRHYFSGEFYVDAASRVVDLAVLRGWTIQGSVVPSDDQDVIPSYLVFKMTEYEGVPLEGDVVIRSNRVNADGSFVIHGVPPNTVWQEISSGVEFRVGDRPNRIRVPLKRPG